MFCRSVIMSVGLADNLVIVDWEFANARALLWFDFALAHILSHVHGLHLHPLSWVIIIRQWLISKEAIIPHRVIPSYCTPNQNMGINAGLSR